jgi:phosphate:Na+ symporter
MEVYECILSLIAGVGVFILAMKLMSNSLNELAGEKMKTLLAKIAGNRIKGVLMGALVTAVIQSSSATTVMVIGFVNVNVMDLNQAAAIIIGSNIGTTATGLLASLESLNISLYLSLLVFIGVMLAFIKRIKKIANLMVGLGMIFVGLKMMSSACNDDSIKTAFQNVLKEISFPLLLEFLGVIFTAIIQSSSAMTGIVIVMVGNGVMGMSNGLFITLGANVGTCVTALIGIIGANKNSKRTAVIHLVFNIAGCLIFTPILWIFNGPIISLLESMVSKEAMQIAYFHLFFNCTTALITTPLIDYLEKIARFVVKDEENPDEIIDSFIKEKENIDIGQRETTVDKNALEEDIIDKKDKDKDKEDGEDKKEGKYEPPKDLIVGEQSEKKEGDEKIEVKDEEKKEGDEKKEGEEKKEEEEKKDAENIEVKDDKKEEEKKEEEKKEEEKKEEDKQEEEKKEEEKKDDEKLEVKDDNKEEEKKNEEEKPSGDNNDEN